MISGSGAGRTNGPFEQTYSFDAFGNTTGMTDRRWLQSNGTVFPNTVSSGYSYQNGRRTYGNSYDADGRVSQTTEYGRIDFGYDSVGDLRYTGVFDGSYTLVQTNWTHFDGDGRKVRTTDWVNNQTTNSYYFNSSVLGKLLFELDGSGGFKKSYVYSPTGQLLARQEGNAVTWVTGEMQGATTKETNSSGTVTGTNELDPLARSVDSSGAYNYDGTNDYGVPAAGFYTPGSIPGVCGTTFGVSMSCAIVNDSPFRERSIQERIATNDWSLGNIWIQMANDRVRDSENPRNRPINPCQGSECIMWDRIRETERFWNNLARGFIEIPEYFVEVSDGKREGITRTGSRKAFVPPPPREAEALSDCLAKILAPYFPDYLVWGEQLSVVKDARFGPGMPFYARRMAAITLGIYDINYDASTIDLGSPTWQNIGIIVEELQHAVQFLEMWAKMGMMPETKGGLNAGRETNPRETSYRKPNYADAQYQWKVDYIKELARTWSYDNAIERAAKQRRDEIMRDLATKYDQSKKPCP